MVKNLPAMQETWVRSLGWEDPLEKEMATHSSILAWRIPWTEEPGFPSSSVVKNTPTIHRQGDTDPWVGSLGQEDPLEKEMVTHSSILAWRIPWMEELGGLQSTGSQRVGHD